MGRSDGAGSAAILAAAVGYGLSTTLSVAVLRQIAPTDLLAVELGGGATLLVVTAAALGRLTRAGSARNLLLGILAPGLAFVLGDLGLSWTSATSGSLLLATEVPLSVVLAVVFLREAVDRTGRWALVCGFAGTALVALGAGRHDDGVATVGGNVLVVLLVAASAVFLVVTRRLNSDDGLNASTWQTVGGALGAAPFVVLNWWHEGSRLGGASPGSWWLAGGILVLRRWPPSVSTGASAGSRGSGLLSWATSPHWPGWSQPWCCWASGRGRCSSWAAPWCWAGSSSWSTRTDGPRRRPSKAPTRRWRRT